MYMICIFGLAGNCMGRTAALQSGVWCRARCSAKGRVRPQFFHIRRHAGIFARQEAFHRVGKGRVRQLMGAVRGHRHQRAGHFVLTLCAALEGAQSMGNAPGERLVVAGVEVQAVDALERAPVAAEVVGDAN